MTTFINRKTLKLMALAVGLAGATMVQAAGNFYFPYDAHEELSGTHATKTLPSEKVELPKIGLGKAAVAYDAHEELSGTHASNSGVVKGIAGKSGPAGELGSAGLKRDGAVRSDLHKIPGDAADGCSKYLRCSGD